MDMNKIKAVAKTIRALSIDSTTHSRSGHPGLPLGCAEIGAVLYGEFMNINPGVPDWINRDRFILSAGHGSMLLYSLLYLSGFSYTLDDLKQFRHLGSVTPGHPEYSVTQGVETTTGPLGAGFSNGVGMAICEAHLRARFSSEEFPVIDHYTYVLAGDGCLMEGISSEAAALAGHLGLGRLIVIYDSNDITIEGAVSLSSSEDVGKRFEAYGWQVLTGDGHSPEGINNLLNKARLVSDKPSLIILNTTIGFGAGEKEGTSGIHGTPLSDEEAATAKERLGIPSDSLWYVDDAAREFFKERQDIWAENYHKWQKTFELWSEKYPEKKEEWNSVFNSGDEDIYEARVPEYSVGDSVPTRKAGGALLSALSESLPYIIGGSADLTPSTNTRLKEGGDFSRDNPRGRNIHFGVREHAMGGIVNGMALYGGLRPFCSTFLVFSDYMRPAIRLAALMKAPSLFVFTHDSVFVGEDGPTHQPVEHLAALRAIPDLVVIRPGDAEETAFAWKFLLGYREGPGALILSRQALPVYKKSSRWQNSAEKGAYIVKECEGTPDIVLLATGSEVSLALKAARESDKKVRVISVLSRELFLQSEKSFRKSLIPDNCRVITIEAGVTQGWEGFTSDRKDCLGLKTFGHSGPGSSVAEYMGLTLETLLYRMHKA